MLSFSIKVLQESLAEQCTCDLEVDVMYLFCAAFVKVLLLGYSCMIASERTIDPHVTPKSSHDAEPAAEALKAVIIS